MKEYYIYNYDEASRTWGWTYIKLGPHGKRWEFKEEYYTRGQQQPTTAVARLGWYRGVFTFFDDSDYMEFMLCRPKELNL